MGKTYVRNAKILLEIEDRVAYSVTTLTYMSGYRSVEKGKRGQRINSHRTCGNQSTIRLPSAFLTSSSTDVSAQKSAWSSTLCKSGCVRLIVRAERRQFLSYRPFTRDILSSPHLSRSSFGQKLMFQLCNMHEIGE